MEARYERATLMARQYLGQGQVAFNTTVYPHWIGDSASFWYVRETDAGREFRLVDAEAAANQVGVSNNAIGESRLFGVFAGRADKEQPHFEELVDGLRGKLLLIHGMLDDVATVAQPLRLVDALQRAGKPIDMLLLPNEGHTLSASGVSHAWDYLVKHLMGVTPPREVRL